VRATDAAGNADESPATRTWTVTAPPPPDTTDPETSLGTPLPGNGTATTASFTFSSNESGSTFACSLDGGAYTACTPPKAYSGLAVGTHTFAVRATDAAGNADESPATHTWTITAPPVTCSTVTLNANADAWMEQNSPSNNKGTDSTLKVRSKGPTDNFRLLVRFPTPVVPAGCVLDSATLRMYSDSARTGRTIQALQVAATWTENGVTWANQPATTGSAATAASGTGYREWTVTGQVLAMASANHGFLLRDATEGQDAEQSYHSREKGQSPPQLVLRFVAAPSGGAIPTGPGVCDGSCVGPASEAVVVPDGAATGMRLAILAIGAALVVTGLGSPHAGRAWSPAFGQRRTRLPAG